MSWETMIESALVPIFSLYQIVACMLFPFAVLLAIGSAREARKAIGEARLARKSRNYRYMSDEFFRKYTDQRAISELYKSRVQLLKQLMLLTHSSVSHFTTGPAQLAQWNAYVKEFPGDDGMPAYIKRFQERES